MKTPSSVHSTWSAGSGSGSVTSSAARMWPASDRRDERIRVNDRAAAGVDEQRAVLHLGDHLGVHQPPRRLRQRREHDDRVRALDRLREPLDRLDPGPRRPRDAPDAHAEGHQPPLDGAPDRAVADDHDAPAGELAWLPVLPAARQPRRARRAGSRSGRRGSRRPPTARPRASACRRRCRASRPPARARSPSRRRPRAPARPEGPEAGEPLGLSEPPSGPRTPPLPRRSSTSSGSPPRGKPGDEDLHPMNEPRTPSPAGPATAPDSTSRAISSAA